jgi:hypothetical protein
MTTISVQVPDDVLALIDAAGSDRTEFVLNAVHEAISHRQSIDVEVSRLLLEDVERDLAVSDDFAPATNDGLD